MQSSTLNLLEGTYIMLFLTLIILNFVEMIYRTLS